VNASDGAVVGLDGAPARVVADGGGKLVQIVGWSPTGDRILYNLSDASGSDVYTASLGGATVESLTSTHQASADGHHRRKLTHDEAVSRQQQCGISQTQLGASGLARGNLFLSKEQDRGDRFESVSVQVHAGPVFQGLCRRQQGERDAQTRGGTKGRRRRQCHAARHFLRELPRAMHGAPEVPVW
jgi:hypothetical protein